MLCIGAGVCFDLSLGVLIDEDEEDEFESDEFELDDEEGVGVGLDC